MEIVMYALVRDGKVVTASLPTVGTLSDGSTVSGYDGLPDATLKAEGWLPLDDPGPPTHDPTTQQAQQSYDVLKTKVNVVYAVVDLPEPEPDRIDLLESRLDAVAALADKASATAQEVASAARPAQN